MNKIVEITHLEERLKELEAKLMAVGITGADGKDGAKGDRGLRGLKGKDAPEPASFIHVFKSRMPSAVDGSYIRIQNFAKHTAAGYEIADFNVMFNYNNDGVNWIQPAKYLAGNSPNFGGRYYLVTDKLNFYQVGSSARSKIAKVTVTWIKKDAIT